MAPVVLRPFRTLSVLVISLILLAASSVPSVAASNHNPDEIDAVYHVTFASIQELDFTIDAHVHKALVEGRENTADELRREYQTLKSVSGEARAESYVQDLLDRITNTVESNLALAFPQAESRTVTSTTIDRETLQTDSVSDTVDVTVVAEVTMSRERLGLETLSDDDVDAVFAAGARFLMDLTLVANPGYSVTYRLTPFSTLVWDEAELATAIEENGRTLVAELENRNGNSPAEASLSAWLTDPAVAPPAEEEIETTVTLDIPSFEMTGGSLPLHATVVAEMHALSLEERFPDTLPGKVDLTHVSSDGLRILYEAGLVADADLDAGADSILSGMESALAGPLGEDSEVEGAFDTATLEGGESASGPVTFTATAEGAHALPIDPATAEGRDLGALFDAGAVIATTFTLASDAGRTTTYVVNVPANAVFAEATDGGELREDGHQMVWVVDNANGQSRIEQPVAVRLTGPDAVVYDASDVELDIVIDIKDLDISVTKAAGGDFGNLLIDVNVGGNLGVIAIPDDVRSELPDGMTLDYLSSDGLRVLVREGIVSEAQVDEMELELLAQMQEKIAGALGSDAQVTGGLDRASLGADRLQAPFGSDDPVVFRAKLSIVQPLAGGAGGADPRAVALYTMEQVFDLPPVDGAATTYTVIFPKGLSVADASATGGDVEKGEQADGREWFRVTPTGEEPAHTTVAMAVTGTFVMLKFWPVLLAAALVLALIVGTPVALMMRKKKGRSGGGAE